MTSSIPSVRRLPLLAVAVAAVLSLWPRTDLRSEERADLSRFVVVGDSLAAGYMNDSLLDAQQVGSFASLIAAQAGEDLPLPLIAAPGVPNVIVGVDPGPPPIIVRAPGVSTGRVNPTVQAMNLAVPGHTVHDALVTGPSLPIDSLTDLVLGLPGLLAGVSRSQVEWAKALAPSTVLLWLGANDVLSSVFAATPLVTPPAAFAADYSAVISRLASTGAALVVGKCTRCHACALSHARPAGGGAGRAAAGPDRTWCSASATEMPLPRRAWRSSRPCSRIPPSGKLPANVVLTAAEAQTIRAAIDAYNEIIAARAEQFDATLVDMHALVSDLNDRGYVVNGRRLTTAFLGGLFSLDGGHPSLTGHAIIANEIIKTMNRRTGAAIPPVSVSRVAAADPLAQRLAQSPERPAVQTR